MMDGPSRDVTITWLSRITKAIMNRDNGHSAFYDRPIVYKLNTWMHFQLYHISAWKQHQVRLEWPSDIVHLSRIKSRYAWWKALASNRCMQNALRSLWDRCSLTMVINNPCWQWTPIVVVPISARMNSSRAFNTPFHSTMSSSRFILCSPLFAANIPHASLRYSVCVSGQSCVHSTFWKSCSCQEVHNMFTDTDQQSSSDDRDMFATSFFTHLRYICSTHPNTLIPSSCLKTQ